MKLKKIKGRGYLDKGLRWLSICLQQRTGSWSRGQWLGALGVFALMGTAASLLMVLQSLQHPENGSFTIAPIRAFPVPRPGEEWNVLEKGDTASGSRLPDNRARRARWQKETEKH